MKNSCCNEYEISCCRIFFNENPCSYQQFYLRELKIIWVGKAIVSLDTTIFFRPFVKTMKAMQFNENFQNHYILVFDWTLLQDAAEQLHYPEPNGESLKLEFLEQKWK